VNFFEDLQKNIFVTCLEISSGTCFDCLQGCFYSICLFLTGFDFAWKKKNAFEKFHSEEWKERFDLASACRQ
jgi:hypothetical protein